MKTKQKRLSWKEAMSMAKEPQRQTLNIELDGMKRNVPRDAYVKAKTKQLVEFGYEGLTEAEVDAQVSALLEGKTLANGLTVIGGFMQNEVKPTTP